MDVRRLQGGAPSAFTTTGMPWSYIGLFRAFLNCEPGEPVRLLKMNKPLVSERSSFCGLKLSIALINILQQRLHRSLPYDRVSPMNAHFPWAPSSLRQGEVLSGSVAEAALI